MFLALYSALLALALVVSSPWWLYRMATTQRYREGLDQRLGLIPPTLRQTVEQTHAQGRPTLWLHAVSVGELFASVRLVRELELALPNHLILVSTTTRTGQKLAQEHFGPHRVFYLPLDFAIPVRRYLNFIRPDLLLLMESELWPRLIAECSRHRIPVVVANARISDRSFPRYQLLRPLWRRIFAHVTLFLAQSEETAQRLRVLGADPSTIQTPGNLKYDLDAPQRNIVVARMADLVENRKILVAGSTVAEEEKFLLNVWPTIIRTQPKTVLVLAPRHPERFKEVEDLLWKQEFQWMCASREEFLANNSPVEDGAIILLDTLGDLSSVYSLASVAFIGGSLVPRGGHNPLESARFAIPTVMGPSYENFREIVKRMEAARAISITDQADLAQTLIDLLQNDQSLGQRAKLFFESQTGATTRTIQALLPLIQSKPRP